MTYDPSAEAVEVVAKALFDHDVPAGGPWSKASDLTHETFTRLAAAALIALMGATVTEPCATCGGSCTTFGLPTGKVYATICPTCEGSGVAAPRSLVVRECELAERLTAPIMVLVNDGVSKIDVYRTPKIRVLYEVPPTPGEDDSR